MQVPRYTAVQNKTGLNEKIKQNNTKQKKKTNKNQIQSIQTNEKKQKEKQKQIKNKNEKKNQWGRKTFQLISQGQLAF